MEMCLIGVEVCSFVEVQIFSIIYNNEFFLLLAIQKGLLEDSVL